MSERFQDLISWGAEKIRWGQFTAPTGGYNATRARARVAAMKLLAA